MRNGMRNGSLTLGDWFMIVISIMAISSANVFQAGRQDAIKEHEKFKMVYDSNGTSTNKEYLKWKIQFEADKKIESIGK